MKRYLLIPLFFIFCLTASAQNDANTNTAISLGGDLIIPSYGIYTVGVAPTVKFETPIINPVSLSLTGGYAAIFLKSNSFLNSLPGISSKSAAQFVPLKGGLKYYFVKGVYAEGEAGAAIELNYGKQTVLAYSIGPGFIIPVHGNSGIDFGIRYESWANGIRQTNIRFAYRFGM